MILIALSMGLAGCAVAGAMPGAGAAIFAISLALAAAGCSSSGGGHKKSGTPTIKISDAQAYESDGSITFTVTRSGGGSSVSVNWETSDNKATAGDDYDAASGTVDLADDGSEKTITIDLIDDNVFELGESFTVTLTSGDDVTFDTDTAEGRILNDEAILSLANLDGSIGFAINGVAVDDQAGQSVSAAGDVNGDGIGDFIIGAPWVGGGVGAVYVVFGTASGFPESIELSELNGDDGFIIEGGSDQDLIGWSVSGAGDLNDDGVGDIIIGAPHTNEVEAGVSWDGAGYVVFGKKSGFAAAVNISSLTGSAGFTIAGAGASGAGLTVSSAGDVNGDGVDDLIIGAASAYSDQGATYVVFGKKSGFTSPIALSSLDGTAGFTVVGKLSGDKSGRSVSSAGDVNGDGYGDLIIGARLASPNGTSSGTSYIVFGRHSFTANGGVIELAGLDGGDGFAIEGVAANDSSGYQVSAAGDVNGDGFGDVIVGAYGSDSHGTNSGTSYVVFGRSSFSSTGGVIELADLDGSDGFAIKGATAGDEAGFFVSFAGDLNGDGFGDLIIGAYLADPNGDQSGTTYVVFGKSEFAASLKLSDLDGRNGFAIEGVATGDQSGFSVSSARDVNGDGFPDLIIGAPHASPNGSHSGTSYVIFGGF